jgi:hypothetical protein
MKQKKIIKTLAVAIILLYIGVGIQPVIANSNDNSDSVNRPDLKCRELGIWERRDSNNIPYWVFVCYVLNDADRYTGEVTINGEGWIYLLGIKIKLKGNSTVKTVDWKNGEIERFDICEIHFPLFMCKLFHFNFTINAEGERNPDNNSFDKHFFLFILEFYPKDIY